MKKTTALVFTLVAVSIGGVLTYYNVLTSDIPTQPAIGIVVSSEATLEQVETLLPKLFGKRVYVAYTSRSPQAVQEALSAYPSKTNTQFRRVVTIEEVTEILVKTVQSHEKDSDFAIIKL